MGKPLHNLAGERFGFLVALRLGVKQGKGMGAWWLCRCECGTEKSIRSRDLVCGKIMSCGCKQQVLTDLAGRVTHGMSKDNRTYRIWRAMLTRCSNERQPTYRHYGARGITVCARWEEFENFLADMGEAPEELSIERIDNDGNYEPGNCRWATRLEQANNARSNKIIEWNGERLTRSQWERRLGMAPTTLRSRLRYGWPLERAMQPLGGKDAR